MLSAQFRFSFSRRSEAFLSPKGSMVKTWFPASGRLAKYLIANQSDIRERYSEDYDFDTLLILERTLHVGSWIQGVVHARDKSASGRLQLDPVQSVGATIAVRYQSQNLHNPVVYGRNRDPSESGRDCIVIKAARLRFRRILKEFLLKVRAKSTEKRMEGVARQPSSSTSGSSQHSTASPVIYFRDADRIHQASDSPGQDLATSDDVTMLDSERERDRDVFDTLLDGILEDHPELDGVILEWDEELVFLLKDETRIFSTPELRRHRFSVESLTSRDGVFGNVSLLPGEYSEDVTQRPQKQLETLREILLPIYGPGEYADAPDPCSDGTRVDILSEIHEWANRRSTPRVFWLAGPAGSGKSAIARSITERLRSGGLIVLPFFFSRATRTRNTALAVPAALAYDLAAADMTARQQILQLVNDEPEILLSSLASQLKRLVFDPLVSALQSDMSKAKQIIFLMDDVDSTVNDDIIDLLAELLPALFGCQNRVKLFITGRDDTSMHATLTSIFHFESISLDQLRIFSLLEVDDATIRNDMELFVEAKWELYSRTIAPAVLASPKRLLARLIDQCGHTFELAAILIRWGIAELTTSDHQLNERRLDEMMIAWETTRYDSAIAGSRYHTLDRLYYILLHKAIAIEDPMITDRDAHTSSQPEDTTKERLKTVIALLVLRTQPLSTEIIAEITTVPVDQLVVLLQGMSSILRLPDVFRSSGGDIPVEAKRQAIEPYSQSFLDFFIDAVRSKEDFHIPLDNYTSKCAAMVLNVVCRPQTKPISRAVEYSALCWHHYLMTGLSGIDYDVTVAQLQLLRDYTHWHSGAVEGFSTMTHDHLKRLASTCRSLLKSATDDAFHKGLETLHKASETRHGRGRRIVGVAYAATTIALAFPRPDISEESFTDFISVFNSVEKYAQSSPDAPPLPTEPEEQLLKKAEELTDHQARSEIKSGLRLLTLQALADWKKLPAKGTLKLSTNQITQQHKCCC
ncbi:hypothetical protein BKA62DRAFT_756687 [Auriculariales sp. MPI-PUGE-AT-0066]|nr:hypothetical protein BKA62DRAFT_756687 [Auriculariales sp. MPI-PUGE-AT-0066]